MSNTRLSLLDLVDYSDCIAYHNYLFWLQIVIAGNWMDDL